MSAEKPSRGWNGWSAGSMACPLQLLGDHKDLYNTSVLPKTNMSDSHVV